MAVTPSSLLAALIVALTALGPLSTDFYLPSLPAIADALGTDSAGVQLTLSVYLLGFGTGLGAVLAVAGEVEHRAEFLLQLQRLQHQLLGAGVVVHGGQGGEGLLAGEQNLVRV